MLPGLLVFVFGRRWSSCRCLDSPIILGVLVVAFRCVTSVVREPLEFRQRRELEAPEHLPRHVTY